MMSAETLAEMRLKAEEGIRPRRVMFRIWEHRVKFHGKTSSVRLIARLRKVTGNRDKWVEFPSLATSNKKMMTEFGPVGFQHKVQQQTLNQEVLLLLASSRVLHGRDMCNDPLKLWENKNFLRNTSSHALLWEEWNCHLLAVCVRVCSVMSDSLWPQGLDPDRPLCPWDSPGKNTGVGCHFLLQRIFPTQQLKPESPALAGGFFITEFLGKSILDKCL